MLKYKRYFK